MDDSKIYGFDPIIFQDSKYLILGTLPGKKSLETKFYYADRGNCFWQFLSQYMGCSFPLSDSDKIQLLKNSQIALWDIYASGIRVNRRGMKKTSRDVDIISEELNNIEELLLRYPNIKRIGLPGKRAYATFIKHYPMLRGVQLSSTSGSNGGQWGKRNPAGTLDVNKIGWKIWSEFLSPNNL